MNASAYYTPASVSTALALFQGWENLSLIELVRRDQDYAVDRGFHAPPAVQLMREGIRDGLSAIVPGKGNRARRRAAILGMQSHNRLWMHLNCC